MKAIFVDIDGVLNHQNGNDGEWSCSERFWIAPDLVANLKTIADAVPDAMIVVISSWRADNDGDWRNGLAGMLGVSQDRITDAPKIHEFGPGSVSGAKGRAHDILLWLSEHGCGDPFVVIDDECTELRKWLGARVVDCDIRTMKGLTDERARKAIAILCGGHASSGHTSSECKPGGCG